MPLPSFDCINKFNIMLPLSPLVTAFDALIKVSLLIDCDLKRNAILDDIMHH